MRLDQFLRASRLVVRRTVAQELCEAGAVLVNEMEARASRNVRAGDTVTLNLRERVLTVRVKEIPSTKQVSKARAPDLYEIVSERKSEDELFDL